MDQIIPKKIEILEEFIDFHPTIYWWAKNLNKTK